MGFQPPSDGSGIFSPVKFIEDLQFVCGIHGAAFSKSHTEQVLQVYEKSFRRGAVLWRITDRPSDSVNYRFYERVSVDTIQPAIEAGLLDPQNPMIPLIQSWSSLFDGIPQQSCDFDAETGLVKAWVYLGGMQPLDAILDAEHVPAAIRQHREVFHSLNLKFVRHVAVDYRACTVNLYFRAPGPLSLEQLTMYSALASSSNIGRAEFEEMSRHLNPAGFTLSVTIDSSSGHIQRVAIYALKVPRENLPVHDQKVLAFFRQAPSYDLEDFNAVAWSFGSGNSTYIKAERSYTGNLVQLSRDWNSALSS